MRKGEKKGQVLWHFISDHDITVYTSACFHERKKNWIHKNSLNNQISESIICHNDELSWLFTNRVSAIKHMKVKRMGITEILRRIWLFSLIKIKSSESFNKQPTQLIIEFNSSLRQIIDSQALLVYFFCQNFRCTNLAHDCSLTTHGIRKVCFKKTVTDLLLYTILSKCVTVFLKQTLWC